MMRFVTGGVRKVKGTHIGKLNNSCVVCGIHSAYDRVRIVIEKDNGLTKVFNICLAGNPKTNHLGCIRLFLRKGRKPIYSVAVVGKVTKRLKRVCNACSFCGKQHNESIYFGDVDVKQYNVNCIKNNKCPYVIMCIDCFLKTVNEFNSKFKKRLIKESFFGKKRLKETH